MSITSIEDETRYVIRLEGDIDVTSSAEMKRTLIEGVVSRKELQLELASATDMDITALQLLWAAWRETEKAGTSFGLAGPVPENIRCTLRDVGFESCLAPLLSSALQANLMAPLTESTDD